MKFLNLLCLLAFLFTFAACDDDDSPDGPAEQNVISLDGTNVDLTQGYYFQNLFELDQPDSTKYVFLTDGGITVVDGEFEGTSTNGIFLVMKSDNTSSLTDGVYTYSAEDDIDDIDAFQFGGGVLVNTPVDDIFSDEGGAIEGGTITVSTTGNNRTVAIAVTYGNGQTATGAFIGELIVVE
ncbi:hypothetical protein [Lewinella sp. 4G2]|uniref:hypothetical protein n=1 Tax=Lewinella sp. 4G2 TaxID=1803372 RepID=UPI0007B4DF11|nr:hypothetical protein [Lewinella sp. 4G2]OAV46029.1 hypothetical protein A3850_017305 [Lewinella sp. 4G2]